jgi:hypothetical protein
MGAFERLRLPLESMTLRHWSKAFYDAVRLDAGAPPEWLAIAALRALGWQTRLGSFVALWGKRSLFARKTQNLPSDYEAVRLTTQDRSSRGNSSVLIASQDGALSESWKPRPVCAALVLRPKEWSNLRTVWSSNLEAVLEAFSHDSVAVDASAPQIPAASGRKRSLRAEVDSLLEWSSSFLDWFGHTTRAMANPIPVFVNEQPAENLPPRYIVIRLPGSLEDYVSRLQKAM